MVPRPRLIEQLNAGLRSGRKLTLISAPAGFGKTTLLSEWVAGSERSVAWVSLDEGDNDPARFLAYFVAALQTIEASIGDGILSALQSPQPPPVETLIATLINQISVFPDDIILVLDDYHLITAQPVHDALTFLLDHLPSQMHLGLATRAEPPLPIARLRGRGQLTELRQADLRFTPDKATEFLSRVSGLELSMDDAATLASRTEGWIAGLQMAALALRSLGSPRSPLSAQGRKDVTGFIQALSGSDRYILDYLVEEVLQRQPDGIQTFLLQTAILDRLTGPLCDAVLDLQTCRFADLSGREILEYLERANLFIVPLDNERQWYRYHRLFADLLRSRLRRAHSDLVPTLHRRASEWHEQNGLMGAAIDHSLSAGDFERAARLVEQVAQATLLRSEVATFLSWVERLPAEPVRARPSLCLFHAWAMLLAGRPLDAVESRLQEVSGDSDLMPGRVAPLRAYIAIIRGQIPRATELSRQALEQLPEDDSFLRGIAAWSLCLSYLVSGDVVAGSQVFDEAIRMSQEAGNIMIAVMALSHLAQQYTGEGQLGKAAEIYERALELATDRQGNPLPIASEPLIGLGRLARQWNDLEAATRYLTEGIELARRWGEIGVLDGYISLAWVKQAQGDVDGARDVIQKARQVAIKTDATELDDFYVDALQARLWIAQGELQAAMRWVEERGLALHACPERSTRAVEGLGRAAGSTELEGSETLLNTYLRKYEHLVLARLLIAQGQPEEALALLEPLLSRQELNRLVIEVQALRALAFQAQGNVAQAMAALEHALSLAEPGGYVRMFVDEGPPMARLLYEAAARGIAAEYAGRLLAAFDLETKDERRKTKLSPLSFALGPSSPALSKAEGLVEPLSERELEVLELIAEGLSNREIAGRLLISLSTVKGHTANIYGKLCVHSRVQALARARDLGLL
jgi:LuxR family maltose regulon positive regulatory protein